MQICEKPTAAFVVINMNACTAIPLLDLNASGLESYALNDGSFNPFVSFEANTILSLTQNNEGEDEGAAQFEIETEEEVEEIQQKPPRKKAKKAKKTRKFTPAEQIRKINKLWQNPHNLTTQRGNLLLEIREHIIKHVIKDKNEVSSRVLNSNAPFINACNISPALVQDILPLVENGRLKKQFFVELCHLNDKQLVHLSLQKLRENKLKIGKICSWVRRMKWAAKIWEASAFLASENGFSGSTEALSGLLGEDKESLEKRFGEEFRELYTKPYNVPTGERSKSLKANYPDSFKAYIKLRFVNANSAS